MGIGRFLHVLQGRTDERAVYSCKAEAQDTYGRTGERRLRGKLGLELDGL